MQAAENAGAQQEVIGELREVGRTLGTTAIREATSPPAASRGNARNRMLDDGAHVRCGKIIALEQQG